jgi:hypothetical protein
VPKEKSRNPAMSNGVAADTTKKNPNETAATMTARRARGNLNLLFFLFMNGSLFALLLRS